MEYSCNGGAFFWVAEKDVGGSWSDLVWEEVKTTSGELVVTAKTLVWFSDLTLTYCLY